MKPAWLLLPLSLLATAYAAQAEGDKCSNIYGSCMDRCVSKPQAAQASCAQSCETSSNQCYDALYRAGARETSAPGSGSEQDAQPTRAERKHAEKKSQKPISATKRSGKKSGP
jgi:hypothetical protein